jgi:hypothetical protein
LKIKKQKLKKKEEIKIMKKQNKKQIKLIIKDENGILSSHSYILGNDFELNNTYGMFYILHELDENFDHLYYDANLNEIEIITSNPELKKEIKAKFDIIIDNIIKISKLIHKAKNLVADTDELIGEIYEKYEDNIETND